MTANYINIGSNVLGNVTVSTTAPTAGQALIAIDANNAAWSSTSGDVVNLAGAVGGTSAASTITLTGNSFITGVLPSANQAAQTMGGDITGTTAASVVSAISGSSPLPITPASLRWLAATASPTITQAAATSDVVPQSLTISPQAPYASAATNKTCGNLIFNFANSVTGYNALNNRVLFQTNGTSFLGISPANTTGDCYLLAGGGGTNSLTILGSNHISIQAATINLQNNGGAAGLAYTGNAVTTLTFGADITTSISTRQTAATSNTTTATGLAGVPMSFKAQSGQADGYTLAGTATGGVGGQLNLSAGTGGAASGATTNVGGAGGTLLLAAGVGGVGTQTNGKGGLVSMVGGLGLQVIQISSSTYTLDTNNVIADTVLLCDPTSNAMNNTIPVTSGRVVIIKDRTGKAATHNITITPASGTIDGASTLVLTKNYDSVTLIGDGTNLNIIALVSSSIIP